MLNLIERVKEFQATRSFTVSLDKKQKIIVGVAGIVLLLVIIITAIFYQSPSKTDAIYSQALEDFKGEKYQNSYYLFSKVTSRSNLKPFAILHQADCAKRLDDKKTVQKKYKLLFEHYPNHKLSTKARYLYAIELVETEPHQASKIFKNIIAQNPETDYGKASEYFLGKIIADKAKKGVIAPSEKNKAEGHFRHYLEAAPFGRWSLNAADIWLTLNKEPNTDDSLLIAKTYYLFDENEEANALISKLTVQESWPLDVQNSYASKNSAKAKLLVETGLKQYSQYASDEDIYAAIDTYVKITNSPTATVNQLLPLANGKGKDYLLNMKCSATPAKDKEACYTSFYATYSQGKFAPNALASIFFEKVRKKDYENAKKIGHDHLNKFPDSESTPMILFWLGKMAQYQNNYPEYNKYYNAVISKYPDSYYAYRAYLGLNNSEQPIIGKSLRELPVEYPHSYSRNNVVLKLVALKDYEMVDEIVDDEFVESWVSYQKGDLSKSIVQARDAMAKLKEKPDKYDLRWRLVYPLNYYDLVKKYADNPPLMLGLMREESYFDPLIQSSVGASGLMQLMPATAKEMGAANMDDLFNPNMNTRLGCKYYSYIRTILGGHDVSSIAAYNGGAGAVQKWKSSLNFDNSDEFIEQIPYPETQTYVKKVLRSYWNYVRIYN